MKHVTDAYILGIKEGRSFLEANPDLTMKEMEDCAHASKILSIEHSNPMKQMFKGEYDFWKNQIKRKIK